MATIRDSRQDDNQWKIVTIGPYHQKIQFLIFPSFLSSPYLMFVSTFTGTFVQKSAKKSSKIWNIRAKPQSNRLKVTLPSLQ